MMIYSQHYFRRKLRKMPAPSCLPIAIIFAILTMCVIVVMPPIITGIKVDMPKLSTQPIEIFDDFTYVTIDVLGDNNFYLNGAKLDIQEITPAIQLIHKNISLENIKVFIKADQNVNYNSVISLLNNLNNNGFVDITLVGKYTSGIQDIH